MIAAVHGDPVAPVALGLAVILVAAKLGGELATRLRQPAVLGELLAGLVLGNLVLVGIGVFEPLKTDHYIDLLARLGVLLLLFEVGLESTVGQMLKVGWSSLLVAVLGVITPFALGWLASSWLLPAHSAYVHAFIGATLTATSVGITARVLQDLGRAQTTEARIILGAAVIDDVLGLLILAVVAGIIAAADSGGSLSYASIGWTLVKAALFLVGALVLGVWLSPAALRRRLPLACPRRAPRLRPRLLLPAVMAGERGRAGGHRRCLRRRPRPGGRALPGLREPRRAQPRRPRAPDLRRSWCRCSSC